MERPEAKVNFTEKERQKINFWKERKIFDRQNEKRKSSPVYSFFDGPPFANGLPHYGHLLHTSAKDSIIRYWISKGYQARRRFGWDCHGLPVEFEIEKRENIKGRYEIEQKGIDWFNEQCRESVQHYTQAWRSIVDRLGRWVDWDDQYRTMDPDFMESVWWVFSELYKKGLVYQDFKVVPYSPRTASVVSNFEANQNYQTVQDPSIVFKFRSKVLENTYYLVWTTTPWSVPSNLAIAVGKDIHYVKILDKASGEYWVVSSSRIDFIYPELKKKRGHKGKGNQPTEMPYEIVESFTAAQLEGHRYAPPFDCYKEYSNAFVITTRDFVSDVDGTGLVHQAPAYGEDDYATCRDLGLPLVDPVDDSGVFGAAVPELVGKYIKDADKEVIRLLKERKALVIQSTIEHSYPFDERTNTPLMYKAVPSWYVAVEKLVDRLVQNNQSVNWVPAHIRDGRMGSWLAGARDWAISRNRFWGTPLPIWQCEHKDCEYKEVFASKASLETKVGETVADLHLHKVQHLTFACNACGGQMRSVGLVFDCWFESGSMPYASVHYPFENKELFEKSFPAHFISEGIDQTRGWFYTLSVLGAALFDRVPFQNTICTGLILDENGKKMSKRHRNYTPPMELIEEQSADAVRLYMLNSPLLKGENLCFSDEGVRGITRSVILPFWNAYTFLATYAHTEGWKGSLPLVEGKLSKRTNPMDRWLISRLNSLILLVDEEMQAYRVYNVVDKVLAFIEDLTNWYIRLNRRRFWGSGQHSATPLDQLQAFETLYFALIQFCKILSPFAPFLAEEVYQQLIKGVEGCEASVHLNDAPVVVQDDVDLSLETKMELLRKVATLGRSARQQHKIKTRRVLNKLTIVTRNKADELRIAEGAELLRQELNVKSIEFSTQETDFVRLVLKPNLPLLGRKLGKELVQLRTVLAGISADEDRVASLVAELDSSGQVTVGDHVLTQESFFVERYPKDGNKLASDAGVTVILDTELTPELVLEGYAREIVNRVQNLRKDAGLEVSDRIELVLLSHSESVCQALDTHAEYVGAEILASSLRASSLDANEDEIASKPWVGDKSLDIEGFPCRILIAKAATVGTMPV